MGNERGKLSFHWNCYGRAHGVFIIKGWNCFNRVAAGMPWGMREGSCSFHWNCYGRVHGVFIIKGWNCFNRVAPGMPWGMREGSCLSIGIAMGGCMEFLLLRVGIVLIG